MDPVEASKITLLERNQETDTFIRKINETLESRESRGYSETTFPESERANVMRLVKLFKDAGWRVAIRRRREPGGVALVLIICHPSLVMIDDE